MAKRFFKYDEDLYLESYLELEDDGSEKCLYELKDYELKKKFLQTYSDSENEYVTAEITFEDDYPVKLNYMRVMGEPRIVAVKNTYPLVSLEHPEIKSVIRSTDGIPDEYSIKPELIDQILGILK